MSRARELELAALIEQYADHQSWRCEHPDRYPWEPDGCPCGLTTDLENAGFDPRKILDWPAESSAGHGSAAAHDTSNHGRSMT